MARPTDCRGLAVTAAEAGTVAHLDATVMSFLAFRRDVGERLKPALAAEPDNVLANCYRGYFFLLMGARSLVPRAAKAAGVARAGAGGATAREQGHVGALEAWAAGDFAGAIDRWDAVATEHPLDVIAVRLANFGHFYRGDGQAMRDRFDRAWPAWHPGLPGYGFMLGARAFAAEEAGAYAEAEAMGREAVGRDPSDVWAAHAVAHVMVMQGRALEGVDWITGLARGFADCHNFTRHLWWHRALFHWQLGAHDAVLDAYDREIWPEPSDEYLDFSNAAALLLRLEMAGVGVGDRWESLVESARARVDDHMMVFADLHYAMALADAPEHFDRFRASCTAYADAGETGSLVMREVGAALVDGMGAFRRGQDGVAVDRIFPVRERIAVVGGSHAQRDVFHLALLIAALRSGRPEARIVATERLRRRPGDPWARRALATLAA